MNNFSKKEWIDLVFEGRNKSYGAYDLRAKSSNIMLKALFIGIMIVLSLISIPVIANYGKTAPIALDVPSVKPTIEVDFVVPINTKIFKNDEKPIKTDGKPAEKIKEKSAEDIIKHVEPIITNKNTVNEELKSVDELVGQKTGTENIKGDSEGKIDAINPGVEDIPGDINGTINGIGEDSATIYADYKLDKKAEFPGGIQNFMRIVQRNYQVPAIDQSKQYTVFVSFVVEIDGTISEIKVLKDPGHGLGNEAIRTLKNIKTKWEPGFYKGKPVRMLHHLPITVMIK